MWIILCIKFANCCMYEYKVMLQFATIQYHATPPIIFTMWMKQLRFTGNTFEKEPDTWKQVETMTLNFGMLESMIYS